MSVLASLALLLGLISMVTPLPGGIILIAGSISTLICTSPRVQSYVQVLRTKVRPFDNMVYALERRVGTRVNFIGTALLKTRPEGSDEKASQ